MLSFSLLLSQISWPLEKGLALVIDWGKLAMQHNRLWDENEWQKKGKMLLSWMPRSRRGLKIKLSEWVNSLQMNVLTDEDEDEDDHEDGCDWVKMKVGWWLGNLNWLGIVTHLPLLRQPPFTEEGGGVAYLDHICAVVTVECHSLWENVYFYVLHL